MGGAYSNPDVDAAVKRMRDELQKALKRIRADLLSQLAELDKDGALLVRDAYNVRSMRQILDTLQITAREAGWEDVIRAQVEELRGLVQAVEEESVALDLPPALNSLAKEDVEMLMGASRDFLLGAEGKLAGDLEGILARSLTGRLNWGDLEKSIGRLLGLTGDQVGARVDATIASFHTQVRTTHFGGEDEDGNPLVTWWLYDGPEDERNRDFCSHFVGTRVTLELLDEYDEEFDRDFPAPPSVSLGGYNCRHELIPLVDPETIENYPEGPL